MYRTPFWAGQQVYRSADDLICMQPAGSRSEQLVSAQHVFKAMAAGNNIIGELAVPEFDTLVTIWRDAAKKVRQYNNLPKHDMMRALALAAHLILIGRGHKLTWVGQPPEIPPTIHVAVVAMWFKL
jgi:hypothetical protein